MKKVLYAIIILLLLTACGNSLLSEDFESDVDQVLPIIEHSYEEQEEFSENDSDLIDSFIGKYQYGQYYIKEDDEYYEMNDVEKAIFHEIQAMSSFAVDDNDTATLDSEESPLLEFYDEAKESLDELMKVKSIESLPDEYKDEYPTYEIVDRIYPEQFEEDTKELIDLFEPIINGEKTFVDIDEEELYPLEDFLHQYKGDGYYAQHGYEQDGKHYINNYSMTKVIDLFASIKDDIDNGWIEQEQIDDLSYLIEELERLDE